MSDTERAGPALDEMDVPEMPGAGGPGTDLAILEARAVAVLPLMTDREIERYWRLASAFAKSGMFKDVVQAEQAFAKILVGRDLGLSPTRAMMGIHLVEGSVMLHYSTIGSLIRQRGYDYKITTLTRDVAEVEFYDGPLRGSSPPALLGVSDFSQEDAALAGLDKDRGSKKSNFVKFPRNMLLARAMSNGAKWFVPEALGGMPVYVPEERDMIEAGSDRGARSVDGAPADEVQDAEVVDGVEWPEGQLGERLRAAVEAANAASPNLYSPARLQMELGGRDEAAVRGFVERVETDAARLAAEARESAPKPAVPEGEDSPAESADAPEGAGGAPRGPESSQEGAAPTAEPEPEGADVLRARLRRLFDARDAQADDPRAQEEIGAEIEQVEAALRDLGASVPGQETLGL